MTPLAYAVDELVGKLNALRFDRAEDAEFRDRTVKRLILNPNNRACVNEAIWLVKVPVLHSGIYGTPPPTMVAVSEYNGGGPEDDISFEKAIKLYEERTC